MIRLAILGVEEPISAVEELDQLLDISWFLELGLQFGVERTPVGDQRGNLRRRYRGTTSS
jgi:hypothetical protein